MLFDIEDFKKNLKIVIPTLLVGVLWGLSLHSEPASTNHSLKDYKDLAVANEKPKDSWAPLTPGEYKIVSTDGTMFIVVDNEGKIHHMWLPEKVNVQNYEGPILQVQDGGAVSLQGK